MNVKPLAAINRKKQKFLELVKEESVKMFDFHDCFKKRVMYFPIIQTVGNETDKTEKKKLK